MADAIWRKFAEMGKLAEREAWRAVRPSENTYPRIGKLEYIGDDEELDGATIMFLGDAEKKRFEIFGHLPPVDWSVIRPPLDLKEPYITVSTERPAEAIWRDTKQRFLVEYFHQYKMRKTLLDNFHRRLENERRFAESLGAIPMSHRRYMGGRRKFISAYLWYHGEHYFHFHLEGNDVVITLGKIPQSLFVELVEKMKNP